MRNTIVSETRTALRETIGSPLSTPEAKVCAVVLVGIMNAVLPESARAMVDSFDPSAFGMALEAPARGMMNEAKGLAAVGLEKNTRKVFGAEGAAIPDGLSKTELVEVKDAARVTDSKQLRIESGAARNGGQRSTLVTGTDTKVSPKAEARFDRVVRLDELGPQK